MRRNGGKHAFCFSLVFSRPAWDTTHVVLHAEVSNMVSLAVVVFPAGAPFQENICVYMWESGRAIFYKGMLFVCIVLFRVAGVGQ